MSGYRFSRRQALQMLGGVGAAAALPVTRAWADAGGRSLNFLAVGDWGRCGEFHQRDVARRMGESARDLGARFVVSVGDNFYDDGVAGIDDPAWRSSFEDVYTAPSLQVPWYVALGNHDYRGNTQAQIDYTYHSGRWRLPARWYKFEERTPDEARVGFFVIDTSPMIRKYYTDGAKIVKVAGQRSNVPVQLSWLDAQLGASHAQWKIVIGHHPIRMGRASDRLAASAEDRRMRVAGGSPDLIRSLEPILRRHRVPLYLNGHVHDLQHVRFRGVHYVCTGAGSRMEDYCDRLGSDFCSLHSGFVACAVNRARLRVAYRDYRGAELHVVDIPRPA